MNAFEIGQDQADPGGEHGVSLENTWVSLENTEPSLENTGVSLENTGVCLENTGPSLVSTGVSLENTGPSLENTGPAVWWSYRLKAQHHQAVADRSTYTVCSGTLWKALP